MNSSLGELQARNDKDTFICDPNSCKLVTKVETLLVPLKRERVVTKLQNYVKISYGLVNLPSKKRTVHLDKNLFPV